MFRKIFVLGLLVSILTGLISPVLAQKADASRTSNRVTAEIWVNRAEIESGERSEFVTVLAVRNPGPPIPGVYVSLSTATHRRNSRIVAAPEAAEIRGDYVDWDNIILRSGETYFTVVTQTDNCVNLYDWGGAARASVLRREPWEILAQAWVPQTKVVHAAGRCLYDWSVEVEANHVANGTVEAMLIVENQFGIDTAIWLVLGWASLTPKELPDGWVQLDDDYAFGWTPTIPDGGTVEIPVVFEIEDQPWDWWFVVAEGNVRTIPGAAWGWTDTATAREMIEKDFTVMYDTIHNQPHLQLAAAMIEQRLRVVREEEKHLLHIKSNE